MKSKCISISKFEQNCINEDAVLAKEKRIAISDGAGGGGLFAERWSQYLLAHLPDIPIENVESLIRGLNKFGSLFIMNVKQMPNN